MTLQMARDWHPIFIMWIQLILIMIGAANIKDIWFMCPSNGSSNTQFAENDEMSEINEPAKQILEGNSQSLNQISANLAGYQIDRNMNLFSKVRENIYHLWHQSNDPRFMQRMPDLDYVDDQLFAFLDGPLSVYNPY
ncbi:uncharacterized protein LOC127259923 isoform X3 [Andrographis paniculata]|uniref:uncharacterized protein LOC127259923 isoform X3 n=1 Tax=Andrographis paniculata TaxID=175694 RepID=UPI0021E6FD66|nr:uncharacterized protein LOC127259923 isoform X3 [Andrographis paniculata]